MKDRDQIAEALAASGYIADGELATAITLMQRLRRPLLLEGEAGVGKTEVAKALASVHATELIRRATPPVLLIDEIDRADDEFEAFLLEVLSDFQITIPEIGTIRAARKPAVILTSNRTRELHDALKRRCLYHWIGHPSLDREIDIVLLRVPGVPERLAAQAAAFVRGLRRLDLAKPPGVAETIDWAGALSALGRQELDAEVVEQTLGSVLKYHEDLLALRDEELAGLVDAARAG